MKNLKKIPLFLLSLCLAFTACSSDDDNNDNNNGEKNTIQQQQEKIKTQLNNNKKVSAFAEAFSQLDLSNNTASRLAIFAVTDQALQNAEKASVTISQALLKRHIIASSLDLTSLAKYKKLVALSGDTLRFEYTNSKLYVNGIELGTPNIVGNSVIFVIDSVMPKTDTPTPEATDKRIKKLVSSDGDESFEFSYDKSNRLSEFVEHHEDKTFDKTTLTYDAAGKLSKYTRFDSELNAIDLECVFAYRDDNSIISTFTEMGKKPDCDTLYINAQTGLLDKLTYSEFEINFEYDANGNRTKTETMGETATYAFDNKKSLLSNQGVPAWFWVYNEEEIFDYYAGANNVMKCVESGDDVDVFSYQYDNDGYPEQISINGEAKYTVEYETF